MIMMNKKLLRKIKQECEINTPPNLEIDEETFTKYLEFDYNKYWEGKSSYNEWSTNQILTRLQELQHLSYLFYTKYPNAYNEFYWYSILSGEYYSILDEIDDRYGSYYHHNHELDFNV